MKADSAEILKQALGLPPEARAALAGSLLDSLGQELDGEAEALWEKEIGRRVLELTSGTAQTVPWSEARRKIAGR